MASPRSIVGHRLGLRSARRRRRECRERAPPTSCVCFRSRRVRASGAWVADCAVRAAAGGVTASCRTARRARDFAAPRSARLFRG
jgi:hypothetical protein